MQTDKTIRSSPPAQKKKYKAPVVTVFGSVAMLTRSSVCSVSNDGETITGFCAPGNMAMNSDRRMKENIRQVGVHPLGIGLYLFDYKPEHQASCGYGRKFGVMADEVETVMPEAVTVAANGFKAVDYDKLGIRLPPQ